MAGTYESALKAVTGGYADPSSIEAELHELSHIPDVEGIKHPIDVDATDANLAHMPNDANTNLIRRIRRLLNEEEELRRHSYRLAKGAMLVNSDSESSESDSSAQKNGKAQAFVDLGPECGELKNSI
jgi:hypothetical protein